MVYQGLVRIVGLRFEKPVFSVSMKDLSLKLDVLVPNGESTQLVEGLSFSVKEYGEVPIVGEFHSVVIVNNNVILVDL